MSRSEKNVLTLTLTLYYYFGSHATDRLCFEG
jgi:hypothetical protein